MKQAMMKVGLSVVTALTGGAAWMIAEPGAQSLMSAAFKPFAPKAEAAIVAPEPAVVVGLKDSQATSSSLGAGLDGLIEIARAARRPDIGIVALTAARARISENNARIAALGPGDGAALELLNKDIYEIALTAARNEITAVSADATKIGNSIRNDFLAAETDLATSAKQLDPDSAAAKLSVEEAINTIKSATGIATGPDAKAVVAAASRAEQALVTLASYKSAGSSSFVKAKRNAFDADITASRAAGKEIAAMAVASKKSNVFSSRERKADSKYVQDSAAWAAARVAELEQAALAISTADRKTLVASAAQAAKTRGELAALVGEVKIVANRLAATKS